MYSTNGFVWNTSNLYNQSLFSDMRAITSCSAVCAQHIIFYDSFNHIQHFIFISLLRFHASSFCTWFSNSPSDTPLRNPQRQTKASALSWEKYVICGVIPSTTIRRNHRWTCGMKGRLKIGPDTVYRVRKNLFYAYLFVYEATCYRIHRALSSSRQLW